MKQQVKPKPRLIPKFARFYKPHMRLFVLDILSALVVAGCNLFYPTITKNIINDFVPNRNLQLLVIWGVALLAIYIVKAILSYFIQSWGHILGVRIQGDMRKELFSHLQRLPYAYFDGHKTGAIMSGIVNDLYEVGELAHHGPEDLFLSSVTIIGAFVMMATVNPWLTLIVFCVMPLIVFFASKTKKRMHEAFSDMREKTAKVNADVETTIGGVRVTKAYGVEEYADKRFERVNENFKQARGSAYKAMGVFYGGMGFITDFMYLLVLVAGGLFFFYGKIDTGEFAAYILYIAMLINPIKSLVSIYEQLQSGMTGFSRFCKVMDETQESDAPGAEEIADIPGDIVFDGVTFAYDGGKRVLDDVSFTVQYGKTTALVGSSGGGKSTICHLLMHFYELNAGQITVDGRPLTQITRKSLRANMGIVAQDVFIFDGTVRENIAFGKIGASEEEIIEAAKNAGIHDFIMTLSDGYDSYVGDRGVKLSGGQRQRISIARAFLKNPPVLILDEATSALDNITEAQIQKSLNDLCRGRTVLVVAHRLTTIQSADQILVLEGGRIAESGTHEALSQSDGAYARLLGGKSQ